MLLSWCVDTCSIAHGSCQGRNGTGPIPWERVAGCEASPIDYGRTLLAKVPSRDGLRGLIARPYIGSGISLQANGWIRALEPNGDMPRWRPGLPCGRAEPAPPRGGHPKGEALRGRPGDDARCGFLGARIARPCLYPYVPLPEVTRRVARDLRGRWLGQAFAIFTGVRSPPLRGEARRSAGP